MTGAQNRNMNQWPDKRKSRDKIPCKANSGIITLFIREAESYGLM